MLSRKFHIYSILILVVIIFDICVLLIWGINLFKFVKHCSSELNKTNSNSGIKEFNDFVFSDKFIFGDNVTGYPYEIVPNIVHYVLFTIHEIEFGHFISILSVLRNQKPDQIMIHCDCDQLIGNYYKRILKILPNTRTKIKIRKVEKPTEIFGKPLSNKWLSWHASDITRIRVLIAFGGIYLDRDVYVVKSLDKFRKYEMTLNWDEGQYLGSQILIGHKNSRFLKLYLDSYNNYDSNQWYYNGGELPTKSILYKNPELVHRVKVEFGVDAPVACPKVYRIYYENWQKEFYTIHLVLRGNEISFKDWCFGDDKPPVMKFDEEIVKNLNVTFGEMTRLLFKEFPNL